eukprot:6341644-Lingulodinium_polyedra.AAC.1
MSYQLETQNYRNTSAGARPLGGGPNAATARSRFLHVTSCANENAPLPSARHADLSVDGPSRGNRNG